MKNLVAALTLRFVDRLSGPSRGAASAIGQLNRAQEMGKAATERWSASLKELDTKLNGLANASLVTDGIGRAGQAMLRPLRAGVSAAAEFGQGMTGIGITAQMTDRQLQPMRRTILDTAAELGALPATVQSAFSSVLAEGVYKTEAELTRAGRSVAKFQALAATMKDPISGDEAGGLSAGLAKSFNISADRLDNANAMLNRASQRGGVGIGVAARFFPAAGAAMRGMGGDNERGLSDLMAATQVAKGAAGGSEQAANNLANLLAALTSPETLRNFSKMGVNLEREIKAGLERGVSPLETAAVITNRLSKGGDQFRLGELFGDRQARDGMMALVKDLDGFRSISADLRSEGLLQAYYADLERAMQGPAASFGRYTSGMARLGIATGTILAPAVSAAADALTRIASWMSNASEKGGLLAKAAVWAFAGLAAFAVGAGAVGHAVVGILGPLLIAKTLMGGMGGAAFQAATAQVVGGFARMRIAAIGTSSAMSFNTLATGLARLGPIFGRARMAALAFNLAMMANPLGVVTIAIAAVVGAVVVAALVVRKYWQPIKAFFGGVGAALGEAFGPALNEIGGALRPLKPLWDAVAGAVGGFFGWLGRLMQPMQATKGQLDGAANAGRNFGRIFVTIFNLTPIGLFARGVMGAFRLIRGAINWRPMETLRQAWSGVSNAVQSAWGPVTGLLGGLWSRAKGVVANGASAVLGVVARYHPLAILTRNWGSVTGWLGGLWSRASGVVANGASAVVGVVARYHPLAILTRNWGPITGWLGGLWSRTRAVVLSGVQSAFTSPLAYLAALPARFRTMGVNIIQGLAQGITSGASSVVQAAVGAANSAVQGARQTLGIRSPSRVFAQIGGFTMEGLALGLSRNTRQPLAAMSLLASAMIGALPAETAVAVRQTALAQPSDTRASATVDTLVAPSAGSVMPAMLASLSPAPAAASAAATGGASGGLHIDQVLIQVSIPAGADATRQGGMAGRAAADSFRARLYDGLNG